MAGNKLHESVCERDLGFDLVFSLSPEHRIRRMVNEANYLLVCIDIVFKYMDKEIFS